MYHDDGDFGGIAAIRATGGNIAHEYLPTLRLPQLPGGCTYGGSDTIELSQRISKATLCTAGV